MSYWKTVKAGNRYVSDLHDMPPTFSQGCPQLVSDRNTRETTRSLLDSVERSEANLKNAYDNWKKK